ncbi:MULTISPECIES: PPOX class F420-dependent oxidoreductase [unclassified Frankia]
MTFTELETDYLRTQPLGRLATVQADGTPQVNPVGFSLNEKLGTIDIGGYNMAASQKFHNVSRQGRAAIVIDDIVSSDPWRVCFLEIRGAAEAIQAPDGPAGRIDGAIIRIHPRRIISFALDTPDREPHEVTIQRRTIS